jgi:hypothetical protein
MPASGADDPTVEELKLRHAWVPKEAELQFGAEPLEYVRTAAAQAASNAACAITPEAATALTIAMTWPEVAPSGEPPSPMTLSRYDIQPTLGDPEGRAPGLWFHPGIGMWQLDSAGLGTDFTAAEAMDAQNAANRMAPFIVGKYCTALNGGATEAAARATAWTDWVACREGACEDTYQRALAGVTPVDGVGKYGGGEVRQCEYAGATYECLFVDAAKAQGATWWSVPSGGRSPVAAPFYVFRLTEGPAVTEVRYWLAADSGAATDIVATRPFGSNARDSLTWTAGTGVCDRTAVRGTC